MNSDQYNIFNVNSEAFADALLIQGQNSSNVHTTVGVFGRYGNIGSGNQNEPGRNLAGGFADEQVIVNLSAENIENEHHRVFMHTESASRDII